MTNELKDPSEKTAGSLLSGILSDLQQLIEQQFQLTRCEIEQEFRQRMAASIILGAGLAAFLLDALMLCLSSAHALHWLTSPRGTDPADCPLWACEIAVAIVLTGLGAMLVRNGHRRFQRVTVFQNPVTEIFQEQTR